MFCLFFMQDYYWVALTGSIPESIGSIWQMAFLSLSFNIFSQPISPSIGNLSNLYWLDF
ncbi:hypothetical protein Pint_33370 [Pistacia integerrima]|uniref:Uncharacterized protein n=1 Tax=Pistacia integerrima TaxID=434235 RepID=A0ACC0X5Q0_9ROSI|nr:hypothetical protein Pint_33370 [Pistacia integerrima]